MDSSNVGHKTNDHKRNQDGAFSRRGVFISKGVHRALVRSVVWASVALSFASVLLLLYSNERFLHISKKNEVASHLVLSELIAKIPEREPEEIKLLFVGDIMLDRGIERQIERAEDVRFPFLYIADELREADITFGNLEGPISDRGRDQGSIFSFRFNPQVIEGLSFAGFDILSLANNHIWDWGADALKDTASLLEAAGIKTVGAGKNYLEANRPAMFTVDDTTIAFFAYTTFYPRSKWAQEHTPGISQLDMETIRVALKEIQDKADIVIVSMHWGEEYKLRSNAEQQKLGQALVVAGADLVVGHHPHVIQEIERYNRGWIAYSLGNFVFDQYFSEETMRGLMLDVRVSNGEITAVNPIEVVLNERFQPRLREGS